MDISVVNRIRTAYNALLTLVHAKLVGLNVRRQALQTQVARLYRERTYVGETSHHAGCLQIGILKGLIYGAGGSNGFNVGGLDDFAGIQPVSNTDSNIYLHIRTPINVNSNSRAFQFLFQGYCFGAGLIVDAAIAGYTYFPSKAILNKTNMGNCSPDSYVDAQGFVVLRLLFPNIYYTTVSMDSFTFESDLTIEPFYYKKEDLSWKLSLSSTTTFP